MARCTFLGLGVMGAPMAGWLQRKGHDVTVWNRTISRAQTWCDDHGGKTAVTPDAAITEAQFIFMCLRSYQMENLALSLKSPFSILSNNTT